VNHCWARNEGRLDCRSLSGQRALEESSSEPKDPSKLMAWYEQHLGLKPESEGSSNSIFQWREKDEAQQVGYTVWAIFPHDTKYFGPSPSAFMINYRVRDLDQLLEQLKREGVAVDEKREEYEYGKFGWITDPEGNRIELWEPTGEPPPDS
jgi:predicted enzyme related to lactoylglutathione lyase